jgi:GNAT superfamily N-acetyltransferase
MMRLRRIEAGDGLLLKSVRLAALEDSPYAFSSSLAAEAARSDSQWAERAAAGSSGASRITVFAEGAQGVLGLVGGYRATSSSTTVELVSMWVSPNARGAGVGRALVAAIIDWARDTGASEVALGFAEGNAAAEGLYAAMGFAATGVTATLPSLTELRMAKPIA